MNESSVVYVSEALSRFDDSLLADLASSAAENNSSIGITGYLYFAKGRFVQCLEGEHNAVDALLERIKRDPRHHVQATSWQRHLAGRRFPEWAMRWVRETELTEIGLETVLSDHVVFAAKADLDNACLEEPIWRIIDSIAKLLHCNKEIY